MSVSAVKKTNKKKKTHDDASSFCWQSGLIRVISFICIILQEENNYI